MTTPKSHYTLRIDPIAIARLTELAKAQGTPPRTLAATLLANSIQQIDQTETPLAA